jgi:hypothetical protein
MGAGAMERQQRVGPVRVRLSSPYECSHPDVWLYRAKNDHQSALYVAVRPNYQTDNHAVVGGVQSSTTVFPNRQYYEIAVGFRPDRFQLLKVGYEWTKIENGQVNHDNVFGVQFVTTFNGLSKALK